MMHWIASMTTLAATAGALGNGPMHLDRCPAIAVVTTGDSNDGEALGRIAQQLLDAVTAGDTATWLRYLDDDGLFTDEEANVRDKRTVIAELRPLSPGITGQICVASPRAVVRGDVAVLTYDALETATVYGQVMHTRYHTTDTYARRNGDWRLLGSHTSVLPSEHVAVVIRSEILDDYVGRYALAPDVEYLVERDSARLFGQPGGGPREELLPLGVDHFFRAGVVRGERFFRRDAGGRVDAMVDRRDNNDLVWRRIR
jgi:ketosteroid isomerase-like protein